MILELGLSFGAGAVGFLSPCVLPLLPGYVGYMSSTTAGERPPLRKALPGTLAFVGGMSLVFIALGASASVLSGLLHDHRRGLEIFSGLFIIALGALMAFGARRGWMLREWRFMPRRPGGGPLWTFGLGAAFAFGWTPCIGPTLGAALNLAATSEGLRTGIALLAAYAAGMGVPFILAGLGLVSFGGRLKRHAHSIQVAGGAVLILAGFLVLTGQLTQITIWMQRVLGQAGLDFWNF